MKAKNRYSIGDVSRICNISKKALRYYDKIGLIHSMREDFNNYRYYTQASLLAVPVIKYYKQMGFKLDEMREFIEGDVCNVYRAMQRSFKAKIMELEQAQEEIRRKYVSVKDWHDLIVEAEMVLDHDIREVSVKYVEATEYLYQEQYFDDDIEASIINIEFTNFVESLHNEITGPVIINFSSYKKRIDGEGQTVNIMQKTLVPCSEDVRLKFGGKMMLVCYHIGPHETIEETYKKMSRWAQNHRYVLGVDSYERYVTDYWTTRNSAQFVTEVMISVSRQGTGDGVCRDVSIPGR
jgi:DNA-binding transcriptional MerR regulator